MNTVNDSYTFVYLPEAEDVVNFNLVKEEHILKSKTEYIIPGFVYLMSILNMVLYRSYSWCISVSVMLIAVPTFWLIYDSAFKTKAHNVGIIERFAKDKVMSASKTLTISADNFSFQSTYEKYDFSLKSINHCYIEENVIVFQESTSHLFYVPTRVLSVAEKSEFPAFLQKTMGDRLVNISNND